ncbi:hypothetical protein C2S52_003918 [Perilla frutescens var. hirtella]|nr:hypothetical protein C2S52_003918 [Perilla frutescens var. hirtella]
MGKRRNADKKSYGGAEGSAASVMNCGGGGGNDSKFSAFEFNEDDLQVEAEAGKTLAKFRAKSPSKKSVHRRKSINKYDFLECFARTDVGMPLDSLNSESGLLSSQECQSSECTSGAKSCMARRKPACHTAGMKHNKILHLESDDETLKSGSFGSSINMGENEGSLEEQSSEYGANSNDCEAVVVVTPYYVKYGEIYYPGSRCRLTFSQRYIRLDGSPLSDKKTTHCVEWSTIDILNIEHRQYDKAEDINLYLRCKDANADGTSISNLGSVELEFVILDDPQWSEKQEEIKSLDLMYKAAWKTIANEYCFEESFEEVVYPDGDPDAVFISRTDIELLQPRTFINDTIIDFYMRYLSSRTKAEEQRRFHFFNTFFFQKLDAVRRDLSRACRERDDAFQSVRKWTRNVNIFEKDYIFIPVNFSLHWSLIIICHPGEVANLRNKDMGESSQVPCILHLDSIRGSHGGFEDLIRSYLREEWKERRNEQDEDISMKFLKLKFVSLQPPQQENLFDCGLFLLHYVERFLELASNCSTTKYIDSSKLYLQLNQDWFFPAEVSLKKRDHIKEVIHRLIKDNALKDPPVASNNKDLRKPGTSDGESSEISVTKYGGEESCCVINFNSADDLDIRGQQCFVPMLEQRNIGKSATKEYCQPCKLPFPTNQSNNLSLLLEEAFAKQRPAPQGDIGSRYKTDELMPPCSQLNRLMAGETSKSCSDESAVTLDVQNEEDRVPEVAFPTERQKDRDESSDHAACVVEDSEDESEVESSIRRTRRPFGLNM